MLVKIIYDDDGNQVEEPRWCYAISMAGGKMNLCEGQFYGEGESDCEFIEKEKGKVTCTECISIIKEIKAIKL